ncbi:MAG: thioredoxin domain-containing protein [Campylobacterales bacterium]|nr:thioredoxin domain-containing protein [Campylobacterales bacterium]
MRLLWILCFFGLMLCAVPNRLIHEESPYLQQHAHNPVAWYAWGDAAFARAKKEGKPIFLSIGYSTCHWCHVMAEESFEDAQVAKLLNRDFIAIKVDKEELPHVDKHYQNLHLLLKKRSGGWPLSVVLSEEGDAFFIATYIPKEDGYGSQGLLTLLPEIAARYGAKRDETIAYAKAVEALMRDVGRGEHNATLDLTLVRKALDANAALYDTLHHGFSDAPKFPEASRLALLFDLCRLSRDARGCEMAHNTLSAMARGGIYDQIDGAFFRYSVNATWQLPHFEKMLYTNAELIVLYARAYALKPDPLYARIIHESIAELKKRFGHEGLYLSASDARSEGEEGRYFLHERDDSLAALIQGGLKEAEAARALDALGIVPDGNLSNPYIAAVIEPSLLERAKVLLRQERAKRPYPFVDPKIITSWNAMMAVALFEASALDPRYGQEALALLDALEAKLYDKGELYHQKLATKPPQQKALLEDYAYMIRAELRAYAYRFDEGRLLKAHQLSERAVERFYRGGHWYLSDDGFDALADLSDRYYTAPLSVMLHNLLDLALLQGQMEYYRLAQKTLERFGGLIENESAAYPHATRAMLRLLQGDVLLKVPQTALLQPIDYPYLLLKREATPEYMACTIGSCFAQEKALEKIKAAIERRAP